MNEICLKCWQTLNNFGQFCEKIKGIHQNLIEVSCVTGVHKYDENTEIPDDEIEQHITTEEIDVTSMPIFSIESSYESDTETFARKSEFSIIVNFQIL